jgi:hypothetical protein
VTAGAPRRNDGCGAAELGRGAAGSSSAGCRSAAAARSCSAASSEELGQERG